MVLFKSSWYTKLYFFSQAWWAYSTNKVYDARRYEDRKNSTADICTFFRSVFGKLPALVFLHVFMYWMVWMTFFQFPIHYLGLSGWFVSMMVIIGMIGAVIGTKFGGVRLYAYIHSLPPKPIKTTPTFFDLCYTWVQAKHDKICVLVTFEDKASEDDDKEPSDDVGDLPLTDKPSNE